MAKKNRIQQPYGYRDMNEYTSEANMLSNAISSIGKCDCNDIANKAFFSVEYKDDLESFTFMNMNGSPVGTAKMYDVKFSKLIESASYNRDTNTIDIIFENKDKVSLDVDGLVPTVSFNDGLEKDNDSVKVKIDNTGDGYLTVSKDGIKISGIKEELDKIHLISGKIDKEISDRKNADQGLLTMLEAETKNRKGADDEIKGIIGDLSSSVTSGNTTIAELIAKETEDRENEDNSIKELLAAETASRESGDNEIKDIISNLRQSTADSDEAIRALITKESEDRIASDDEIKNIIGDITSSITSGNTSIVELIKAEANKREEEDTKIKELITSETEARTEAINTEKTDRENADNEIRNLLSAEESKRVEEDNKIKEDIVTITSKIDGLSDKNKSNVVNVVKVSDNLPATIRERYKFVKSDNTELEQTIDIYKDSSLMNVELQEVDNKKCLVFTYILEDGTEKNITLDVEQLLIESEFQDGLSGVSEDGVIRVKVKIDESSEEYLTVSKNGVKLSGINAKFNETDTRIGELNTKIETETTNREQGITDVNNRISDTNANVDLKADKTYVDEELAKKATNDALNKLTEVVDTKAASEYVDTELEKKADKTYVDDELSKKATNDALNELSAKVDTKASTEHVDTELSKKATIDALNELSAKVNENKASAENLIANEAATRESALTDEKTARETSDNELSEKIESLKNETSVLVKTVVAKDTSIAVDSADVVNPKIGVNVSAKSKDTKYANNISVETDGLFSVADLEYDGERNILTFVNNAKTLPIYLKSVSSIPTVSYNPAYKKLTITYIVNGVSNTVEGDMSALDNTFTVSESTSGAMSLVMNDRKLSGSVIVNTTHDDNALIVDNNSLYVSKNSIIGDLERRVQELEAAMANLVKNDVEVTSVEPNMNESKSTSSSSIVNVSDLDLFDFE